MTIVPIQYPHSLHQTYIESTGNTSISQIINEYRIWHLCVLLGLLTGTALNVAIYINPYYYFGAMEKASLFSGTIGLLVCLWQSYSPSQEDREQYSDYLQIRQVLKEIEPFTCTPTKVLMEAYRLTQTNGIWDARNQVELSNGIHNLLVQYASLSIGQDKKNNHKKAEYWRTKFGQTLTVAVTLRLIPYWYEIQEVGIYVNAWNYYFDQNTVGIGVTPSMNWAIVTKDRINGK